MAGRTEVVIAEGKALGSETELSRLADIVSIVGSADEKPSGTLPVVWTELTESLVGRLSALKGTDVATEAEDLDDNPPNINPLSELLVEPASGNVEVSETADDTVEPDTPMSIATEAIDTSENVDGFIATVDARIVDAAEEDDFAGAGLGAIKFRPALMISAA